MAGIDKIYGTQEQYLALEKWLIENQKPIKSRVGYNDVLPTDYLYAKDGYDEKDRPISNFPPEIDKWLKENCPLDFVQERLKEQYGESS